MTLALQIICVISLHIIYFILAFTVMRTKQLGTCGKQNQFYLEDYLMFYETKMNLCLIMCGFKMKPLNPSWE